MPSVRYSDFVEQPKPGEAEVIGKITASMTRTGETTAARYHHAALVFHAKSTACLKGGLWSGPTWRTSFAKDCSGSPEPHPVLDPAGAGPGELLKDDVSTHRGLAIKVLGVAGREPLSAGRHRARPGHRQRSPGGLVQRHVVVPPSCSLEAFRPLGSIRRARLTAYDALSAWRRSRNKTAGQEPRTSENVPH